MTDQPHAPGAPGNFGAWQPVPGGGDYDPDQTMHVSFAAQLPPEPLPGEDPLVAHGPAGPGGPGAETGAGDAVTQWSIPVIREDPEADSGEFSVGAYTAPWEQAPAPATTQSFPAGMFGQGAAAALAAQAEAAAQARAVTEAQAGYARAAQTPPAAPAGPPGTGAHLTGQWAIPFADDAAPAPWLPAHPPAADAAWSAAVDDPERPADPVPYAMPGPAAGRDPMAAGRAATSAAPHAERAFEERLLEAAAPAAADSPGAPTDTLTGPDPLPGLEGLPGRDTPPGPGPDALAGPDAFAGPEVRAGLEVLGGPDVLATGPDMLAGSDARPGLDATGAAAPLAGPEPLARPEALPGLEGLPGFEGLPGPDGPTGPEDTGAPEAADDDAPAALETATGPSAEPAPEALPFEPEPLPQTRSEHPLASYMLRVNGTDRPVTDAWLGESLLYVLRERLGLAGAKDGCEQGECGACSVQVDGRLVASCLVPAATAAGSEVRTVEGLSVDGRPSDVQAALAECGAVQCGFCIPGMAMTVHDLLEGNHKPTDLDIRQALSGNLCRCSGYRGVIEAVREVVAARDTDDDPAFSDEARIPHQGGPGTPGGAV